MIPSKSDSVHAHQFSAILISSINMKFRNTNMQEYQYLISYVYLLLTFWCIIEKELKVIDSVDHALYQLTYIWLIAMFHGSWDSLIIHHMSNNMGS